MQNPAENNELNNLLTGAAPDGVQAEPPAPVTTEFHPDAIAIPTQTANEHQVAGNHYAGAYQHWDFVQEGLSGAYMEGQVTRYVSRARRKNGKEDYEKARHYVQKMLEFDMATTSPMGIINESYHVDGTLLAKRFCHAQDLNAEETEIITLMAGWRSKAHLRAVDELLGTLIANYDGQRQ